MNSKKFKNAKMLCNLLELDGTSDRGEYWTFRFHDGVEIPIMIVFDEYGTYLNCRCKHCSVRNNKYLCSYKIALVLKKAGVT